MTAQSYPKTFAPAWDYLEANAVLGELLLARTRAETELVGLIARGGDGTDTENHLVRLVRAEVKLRHAMEIDDRDDEMRNAGVRR